MPEPRRSRKQISRGVWQGAAHGEEARAYLQSRLMVFSKLMFWTFVVDITLLAVMYRIHQDIKPAHADAIAISGVSGLVILVVMWRGVLARRPLDVDALYRVDLFYAIATGTFLGAGAYFASDLRPAAYTALVLGYGVVFTRALIIPSSSSRDSQAGSWKRCGSAGSVISIHSCPATKRWRMVRSARISSRSMSRKASRLAGQPSSARSRTTRPPLMVDAAGIGRSACAKACGPEPCAANPGRRSGGGS